MLLRALLRALAQSFPCCSRGLAPQAGAPALLAVLGAWETALVSVGPGVLPFPSRSRACREALEPAPSPHYGPLATRGEAVPLESSSAVLPQITCSQILRAWHGTYRASAMSTKAQAGGEALEREAGPTPRATADGLIRPCSPEPWPTSWGSSEPYCTSFVSSSSPTTHFPLKKQNKKLVEKDWKRGAWKLEPFSPHCCHPLVPSRAISRSKDYAHLPCGFLMAVTGVLSGPLVLACGGTALRCL